MELGYTANLFSMTLKSFPELAIEFRICHQEFLRAFDRSDGCTHSFSKFVEEGMANEGIDGMQNQDEEGTAMNFIALVLSPLFTSRGFTN
jgi:hypothetical protein